MFKFDEVVSNDQAYPTNRLLDGTPAHWAAEEWKEDITYQGKEGARYYLFTASELEGLEIDNYPFDSNHVDRYEFA